MIYLDKQECYDDILISLTVGVLAEEDIHFLLEFYKETENYECCAGVVEAYAEYKKRKDDIITED